MKCFPLNKILSSKLFWLDYFSFGRWIESILATYGAIWGVIQVVAFFIETSTLINTIKGLWWLWLILGLTIGSIIAIRMSLPKTEAYFKFENSDIHLGYKICDIFELLGDKVIPVNTNFHMRLKDQNGTISHQSIQGQFSKQHYSNPEHLEHDINQYLERMNLALPVDIGTVIPLDQSGSKFYLVASNELNDHGHVHKSSFENIQACLNELWRYVEIAGSFNDIVIPLLGSGMTKINKPRIDFAKEIIKSFSAAISQSKICERLTICIHPKDFKNHSINVKELEEFIKYTCKFKEFDNNLGKQSGSPIEK